MLPILLVVGLATGVAAHDRHTLRLALGVGAAASALFAVVIAATADDLSPIAGLAAGFGLAFANHLVGLVLGAGVRGLAELLARGVRRVARV